MVSTAHITPFDQCKDLLSGSSHSFLDDRGMFSTVEPRINIVHMNLSKSNSMVVRGLHYQRTCPQAKLVWCLSGQGIDVALDLRSGSETYGKLFAHSLSVGDYVFIPKGFAHGLISMNKLEVIYAVDAQYSPEHDTGVNIESIDGLHRFSHFRRSTRDKELPEFTPGQTYCV